MKKIIALMLSVLLCISVMAVTASAAGSASLSVGDENGFRGNEVTVNVALTGNEGMNAMLVNSINYDSSRVELIETSFSDFGGGRWFGSSTPLTWERDGDTDYNGTIITLTFKILDNAPFGKGDVSVTAEASNWDAELVMEGTFHGSVEVLEPAHEHSWSEWKTTKEATCTEDGVQTRTCDCGESETKAIPAPGHKFGDWKVTTEPDCTNDGVETRACSVCGEKETRLVDATGHDHNNEWSTDGENHWHECDCGDKADLGKHVDKDNNDKCDVCGYDMSCKHDWGKGVYHAGENCGQEGYTEYTCSKCGETKKEYDGKFGPHIPENEWSKDEGNHWHECSICGEDLDKGAHVDRDKDNYCDVCQKNLGTGGGSSGDKDDVLKTGDITPYITFTAAALISMVAAAGYVLKRKFVK